MISNETDEIKYYQKNREILKELLTENIIESVTVKVRNKFIKNNHKQSKDDREVKFYSDNKNNWYEKMLNFIDNKRTESEDLFLLLFSTVKNSIHIENIVFKDGFILNEKNEEEKGFENLFIEDIRLFIK